MKFLDFIVPCIVFAVIWYFFVTAEFIFNNKREGKASPWARDAEDLLLPAVDSSPAQVVATEEEVALPTECNQQGRNENPQNKNKLLRLEGSLLTLLK